MQEPDFPLVAAPSLLEYTLGLDEDVGTGFLAVEEDEEPRMSFLNFMLLTTNQQSIIKNTPSSRLSLRKINARVRIVLDENTVQIKNKLLKILKDQRGFFETATQIDDVLDVLRNCMPIAEHRSLITNPHKLLKFTTGIKKLMRENMPPCSRRVDPWSSPAEQRVALGKILQVEATKFTEEPKAGIINEFIVANLSIEELGFLVHNETARTRKFKEVFTTLSTANISTTPSSSAIHGGQELRSVSQYLPAAFTQPFVAIEPSSHILSAASQTVPSSNSVPAVSQTAMSSDGVPLALQTLPPSDAAPPASQIMPASDVVPAASQILLHHDAAPSALQTLPPHFAPAALQMLPQFTATPAAFETSTSSDVAPASFQSQSPSDAVPPASQIMPASDVVPAASQILSHTDAAPSALQTLPPPDSAPAALQMLPPFTVTPAAFQTSTSSDVAPASFQTPSPSDAVPAAFQSRPVSNAAPAASQTRPPSDSVPAAFQTLSPSDAAPAAYQTLPPSNAAPAAFQTLPPPNAAPAAFLSPPSSDVEPSDVAPAVFKIMPPSVVAPAAFQTLPPSNAAPSNAVPAALQILPPPNAAPAVFQSPPSSSVAPAALQILPPSDAAPAVLHTRPSSGAAPAALQTLPPSAFMPASPHTLPPNDAGPVDFQTPPPSDVPPTAPQTLPPSNFVPAALQIPPSSNVAPTALHTLPPSDAAPASLHTLPSSKVPPAAFKTTATESLSHPSTPRERSVHPEHSRDSGGSCSSGSKTDTTVGSHSNYIRGARMAPFDFTQLSEQGTFDSCSWKNHTSMNESQPPSDDEMEESATGATPRLYNPEVASRDPRLSDIQGSVRANKFFLASPIGSSDKSWSRLTAGEIDTMFQNVDSECSLIPRRLQTVNARVSIGDCVAIWTGESTTPLFTVLCECFAKLPNAPSAATWP